MNELPSLEYLGGLFDGSAQLGIHKSSERQPQRLVFRIGRAEPDVPEMFCKRFGGHVRREQHGNARIYRWEMSGKRAQAVLRELLPFMHVKRREVERYCAIEIGRQGLPRGSRDPSTSIGSELQRVST